MDSLLVVCSLVSALLAMLCLRVMYMLFLKRGNAMEKIESCKIMIVFGSGMLIMYNALYTHILFYRIIFFKNRHWFLFCFSFLIMFNKQG